MTPALRAWGQLRVGLFSIAPSQWLSALHLCLPSSLSLRLVCMTLQVRAGSLLCSSCPDSQPLLCTKVGPGQGGVVELLCLLAAYSASRTLSVFAWDSFFLPCQGCPLGSVEGKVFQLCLVASLLTLRQGCTLGLEFEAGHSGCQAQSPSDHHKCSTSGGGGRRP